MDFPDHPFWNFTVGAHRRPGVHEACLALQQEYGMDVNLLFYCCWIGASGGGRLGRPPLLEAMASVEGWQEGVVRPVWRARHLLKEAFPEVPPHFTEPLRQALIVSEIDAEHIEQLQLAKGRPEKRGVLSDDHGAGDAACNLRGFLALFLDKKRASSIDDTRPPRIPEEMRGALTTILAACFPALEPSRIKTIIAREVYEDGGA